jgi:hypothetical protein
MRSNVALFSTLNRRRLCDAIAICLQSKTDDGDRDSKSNGRKAVWVRRPSEVCYLEVNPFAQFTEEADQSSTSLAATRQK